MSSIRCRVTLLSNKNRKVDIEIHKEKDGKRLWNLIKSAGGNLPLPTPNGNWETNHGAVLLL